jgi:probable selenium-dependent hydroxylase accessory protein YqeC
MTSPDLVTTLLGQSRLTCLVGAGGKKTTMYALAGATPGKIALSSTSHMYPYDGRYVDAVITLSPGDCAWPAQDDARVVAFAGETTIDKRVGGLTPAQIAALLADRSFERVLLKADGARARWIKAPAAHEPIIPPQTERVIYLVSAKVIGRVLDERIAHRPELLAEITGARIEEPLTSTHIGRLLASNDGALKGIGEACIVPVLNMVDDEETLLNARAAAKMALNLTRRFDEVVLATMREARVVEVVARDLL